MTTNRWQVQNAKNKLSEVIEKSVAEGPQIITKHGEDTVVVISYTEYKKFAKPEKPNKSLKELLMNSELHGLDLARDRTTPDRATPFTFED